jgi:lipoate-protein ligase A
LLRNQINNINSSNHHGLKYKVLNHILQIQSKFESAVLVNGSFLLDFGFDEMDRVLKNPTKNLAEGVERARDGMITLSELLNGAGYDIHHVKGALKRGF